MRMLTVQPVKSGERIGGSLEEIALHDFSIFKGFFDFDLDILKEELELDDIAVLKNYVSTADNGKILNKRIRDRIVSLSRQLEQAEDVQQFLSYVAEFYKDFGVGNPGTAQGIPDRT